MKEPLRASEGLVEALASRAQKCCRDGVIARQEAKRFQFVSMSVDFQNGQQKRQYDHGIDKGW